MARIGRPKADKPKAIEVKARIDTETNKKLLEYCAREGKTKTQVVREGIDRILGK